jgi:AcrR family transcriptional regulator
MDREPQERLPPGRHGIPSAAVGSAQRRRLQAAAGALFAERGFAITSRQVASRAHVSSTTLYTHFDDLDDVLRAAFEEQSEALLAMLAEAEGGMEALLLACAAFLAADEARRALFTYTAAFGVWSLGPPRERLLRHFAALLAPTAPGEVEPMFAAAGLAFLAGGVGNPWQVAAELAKLLTRAP